MTRKRFNKLLLARGYDRNGVAAVAKRVSDFGTYDKLYKAVIVCADPGEFSRALEAVAEAYTRAAAIVFRAVGTAAEAASAAFIRFADSLEKGLKDHEND